MPQQPTVEIAPGDLPLNTLEPGAARRQTAVRPGTILTPAQKPEGRGYGTPGPDTGWALRILAKADLPDLGPTVEKVLAALMGARAAHFGRAPTPDDMEVALLLAGLGRHSSEMLDARRERWVIDIAHERSPGRSAVAEVGDLLRQDLAHVDLMMRR